MRLLRGRKRFLDSDVELLTSSLEPGAASSAQGSGFLDLGHAEQITEEPSGGRLASRWRGELDMVKPFDEHLVN